MSLIFGWRTAVLTVAAAVLLPLAGALWSSLRNRTAARTLAAVLVVMTGVFAPWTIGFAGLYDRWPWLGFAPFANPLLVPALLYLHAFSLAEEHWPARGWRHLIPGGIQFAYQSACFLLPLPLKERWAHLVYPHGDLVGAGLLAISFAVYGIRTAALLRSYRHALADGRSDEALFDTSWLSRATVAFAALALIWAAYLLADALAPLSYKGLMPLYVVIAGAAMYLGIAGWRHLAVPFPTIGELRPPATSAPPARDWAKLGEGWAERMREAGWYREESLTLRQLAGLLGTNESYLSRALNEGLGVSFSEFVNGLRCDEVAAALRNGDERPVLTLALEAGFASKASFNRSFRQRFGTSPTAMRRAAHIT